MTFHFHSSDYIASNSNIMSQGLVMSCLVSSSNNFHIILMFVTWLTSHVKKTLTYPVCEQAVLLGATHFEIINNLTCKRLHNHSSTRVNFFLLYQCALQISSYEFFIDKTSFLFVNTWSSNKPNSFWKQCNEFRWLDLSSYKKDDFILQTVVPALNPYVFSKSSA